MKNRNQIIIRTSLIGIGANVLLAAVKAAVGILAHSIAIVMDAVNNLSDALSSLITIIGTRLSQKPQDKEHPLGHGRVEYLSATLIAVIVLYAGVTSLVESVKKIITPETPDYTTVGLILVALAVPVKLLLGAYVKKTGQRVQSDALTASGTDAKFDALISTATLVAAGIFLLTGLSLEAWLGAAIALVIIRAGIGMLRRPINEILGERVDPELAAAIRSCVCSFPEVLGAYDLVTHNYGRESTFASVHIALPASMTVRETDLLERQITEKLSREMGVIMTGISVYSVDTESPVAAGILEKAEAVAARHPEVLQTHGLYVDEDAKLILMDAVIDFAAKDRAAVVKTFAAELEAECPGYRVNIVPDADVSDLK